MSLDPLGLINVSESGLGIILSFSVHELNMDTENNKQQIDAVKSNIR